MPPPLTTKRWDDPASPTDGTRILITRYRPRGLPKANETWTEWLTAVAPSKELLAAYHGKSASAGGGIPWSVYRTRYLSEMKSPEAATAIKELADRVSAGEALCLLCSSACTREARCHRSILAEMIREQLAAA